MDCVETRDCIHHLRFLKDAHAGHIDVGYRCVSRRNLVCIDDEDTLTMQAWLEKKFQD